MRLLIVEDEPKTGRYLQQGLTESGFVCDLVADGVDGLHMALTGDYDLIVLDVALPKLDGWTVVQTLRASKSTVPVLFLTARDSIQDRVRGLDLGADDYLVKPFAFAELLARVRALGRRQPVSTGVLQCGAVLIDSTDRTVRVQGATVTMSPREFTLLRLLAGNAGQVMTKTRILTEVWGSAQFVDGNVVEQYVSYLRRKLDPATARLSIETVRGSGYRLVVEQEVPQ